VPPKKERQIIKTSYISPTHNKKRPPLGNDGRGVRKISHLTIPVAFNI